MKRTIIVTALLVGVLAACAPPFPRDLLEQVAQNIPYEVLHKDPDQYKGKLLMLGGMIVATKNLKDGTRIEVLQKPLDGQGRPLDTDATGGRFLINSNQFLDSAVYYQGRTITVIGDVSGQRALPLGETEYRYPELTARSIHLWSPSSGPRFSFGIGVYRGF